MTYLVCSLPRVQCPTCGVRPAHAPWTEPNSHFTLLFQRFAISVLQATQVQSRAAELLRLSPDQVHRIMHRAVRRGLARRSHDEVIRALGIDEKSFSEGHCYATVLSDTERGRVLDLVETRTKQAATTLLEQTLTPAQREQVQSVSMDLWPAFAHAARKVLPSADIVHDRFHISGYLNEAVDNTRKSEHARLLKEGSSPLKKSKYLWLKNPDKLTAEHKALFETLSGQGLETAKVWAFKEAFRQFFESSHREEAAAFFANWYDTAVALGNRSLTKVAHMLQKHLDGLLAYVTHRTTNAKAEAINSHIQLVKANARGYRRFQNLRVAVLFFQGQLQLNP
jgi:transposase